MSAVHIAGFVISAGLTGLFWHALFNRHTNAQGKVICLLILIPAAYFAVLNGARLFGAP